MIEANNDRHDATAPETRPDRLLATTLPSARACELCGVQRWIIGKAGPLLIKARCGMRCGEGYVGVNR